MNKIHVHAVGDTVWVIKGNKVISAKVHRQEWWGANKDTPVYYDLIDNDDKIIGSISGNSIEVWQTKQEAVDYYLHSGFYEGEPEVC